jgi:phosphate-selective porin OprO/OprP
MKRSLLAVTAALALAGSAHADVRFSPDHGLVVRFREIDTRIHVGGRVHLDYAFFDDDLTPIDDDFDVRRGRPEIDVSIGDAWKAKFEYEIAAKSHGLRAAWVQWNGVDHLKVRLGNQTMPFGLEEQESSNDIVFNERSLASALAPNYGTGVVVGGDGRLFGRSHFTAAGGVYAAPFGDDGYDRHGSDHIGVASRATFAPLARKRSVVQFGASVDYRSIRGANDWRASRRPESQLAPTLLGDTLTEVDSVTSFGVEAAAMWGPVLFQGEYMRSSVNRESGSLLPDADFDGAYAQLSWVLTGERHRYAKSVATFGGVKPRRAFGALEASVRWSTLDLTDNGELGGEADDVTVGLAWWIRENARFQFNYVRVNGKQSGTLLSDDPQIFALRFIYHL